MTVPSSTTGSTGVKPPKIDVVRFDSSILDWRTFWEQFEAAIHDHARELIKHECKPTTLKTCVCIFVSLTVKAVHLDLVSYLTTEPFLVALRWFVSSTGKPSLLVPTVRSTSSCSRTHSDYY